MQIPFNEIDTLIPTKCQDILKVNIENKADYKKVKWLLSRIPIRWAANDFTRTIYFCGRKHYVKKSKETSSD